MAGTHARMMRAAVTAVVVFSLAAGAHLAGGAALPGPHILAALGASTLAAVTVLARRRLSLPAVLATLGGGQVLLHEAFTALTTTAVCVPTSRGHFGPQQVHCMPAGVSEHAHAFSLFDRPVMAAAHTAAVVLTALMLYYGETAAGLALRWLRPLAVLPRLGTYPPLPDLPRIPEAPLSAYLEPLLLNRPLRGPPVAASL